MIKIIYIAKIKFFNLSFWNPKTYQLLDNQFSHFLKFFVHQAQATNQKSQMFFDKVSMKLLNYTFVMMIRTWSWNFLENSTFPQTSQYRALLEQGQTEQKPRSREKEELRREHERWREGLQLSHRWSATEPWKPLTVFENCWGRVHVWWERERDREIVFYASRARN